MITPIAAAVLLVIIIIATLFILRVSIKDLLIKLGLMHSGDEESVPDGITTAKEFSEKGEFKLNEGVPIQKGQQSKDLSKQDDLKEALTIATDPDWRLPDIDLLIDKQDKADPGDIEANADIIKDTLAQFLSLIHI